MKISKLKQPYRRMAEYYRIVERSELTGRIEIYIPDEFPTPDFNNWFWTEIQKGKHPEITEEIKEHFPPDFDFSGEEIKTKPVMQMLDLDTQKAIYTQLAKEGRFDELPATCEFSESVLLLVWDDGDEKRLVKISGKYKGLYMLYDNEIVSYVGTYQNAQLPTKKIDFSQFKTGDVVEVVRNDNEHIYGLLWQEDEYDLNLTFSNESDKSKYILKKDIKSITKIK
jgi:hypothetical protein